VLDAHEAGLCGMLLDDESCAEFEGSVRRMTGELNR
jgi:hypothetical protein